MLSIEGLHHGYGAVPVLKGVDLRVAAGEIVSLVGPNGAGKSTLLKCINGILSPAAGRVAIADRPAGDYSRQELARTVAYVPQHAGPALSLPVLDMVWLGRAPHRGRGTARGRDREVVMDAVERLRLEPFAFRLFGELSGGERQRVLIARALAQEGRLMLLDEPTNALDLRHQLDTMVLVQSIARERRIGVLIAIHDLALAGRFSDRLVMMAEGRVHAEGCWSAVLTPAHLAAVYGVSALIGTDRGLPYVIPIRHAGPS